MTAGESAARPGAGPDTMAGSEQTDRPRIPINRNHVGPRKRGRCWSHAVSKHGPVKKPRDPPTPGSPDNRRLTEGADEMIRTAWVAILSRNGSEPNRQLHNAEQDDQLIPPAKGGRPKKGNRGLVDWPQGGNRTAVSVYGTNASSVGLPLTAAGTPDQPVVVGRIKVRPRNRDHAKAIARESIQGRPQSVSPHPSECDRNLRDSSACPSL
jgi:hypothetical protein